MMKNVRHISEGTFYGLRVTNKAKNVSLDKKLRTLEACKDAQNHCYRKEEKDLINTLMRLQKSKEHYHHTDELVRRHVDHTEHKHHGRQPQKSSSNASLVAPLTPVPSLAKIKVPIQMPQHPVPETMAMGSDIHRTTGFTNCVICRLPRNSQLKGTDICRCEKGPDKGTHHMHPPACHEDKKRPEYLHAKEKKELYEKLHPRKDYEGKGEEKRGETDQMFLEKLQRDMQHVIEAPLQLNKEYGYDRHSPHIFDKGHLRRRRSSLVDERLRNHRGSILEEGHYVIPRDQRRMTNEMYESRQRNDSSGGESCYSVGEIKSRSSTMDDPVFYRKTFRITHSAQYPPSPPEKRHSDTGLGSPGFSAHDDSHLPRLTAWNHGSSTEAFHGLIHPDNIINHHHYLPYEAERAHKRNHKHNGGHHDDRHHGDHHRHDDHHHHGDHRHDERHHHGDHHHHDDYHHERPHLHGYYIHKYDHTGTRQIAHIPLGANSHIAEMIHKQYEPKSNHYSLLSNLRQLLSVYQRMDETMPRYPWPTPPTTEVTKEEFQKLKDCRYLRLPKRAEETTIESPVFH